MLANGEPAIIDATAVFNGVVSGSYADADQIINIEGISIPNSTANIYSYCSQEADGNIQAGDLQKAGPFRGSFLQVQINGVWSEDVPIQYYKTGGGNTGEIKMRASGYIGGQPQTAVDWSTVPGKAPLRFRTGKGTVTWTNQAGTSCSGIYNYSSLVSITVTSIIAANITTQFGTGFGVCYPIGNGGCYSPICPVAVGGFPPYTFIGFQPQGGGGAGQGSNCGGALVTC